MNQLTRPMPRPTAQVEPFVDALGAELAVRFLIFYGGAKMCVSDDPKGRSSHEAFLGYDAAKRFSADFAPDNAGTTEASGFQSIGFQAELRADRGRDGSDLGTLGRGGRRAACVRGGEKLGEDRP